MLESANILFNRGTQGNMGSLLDQQLCIWDPLNIFIVVFSSVRLNKNKRNSEKHTEIFLVFLVFLNKQIKGKSKNEKNYLHGKAPNKEKKIKEMFLGFLFSATTNYSRKKNQKDAGNIFVYSQSFSNTQEESEKIKFNMDNTMKSVNTDNWNVWTRM